VSQVGFYVIAHDLTEALRLWARYSGDTRTPGNAFVHSTPEAAAQQLRRVKDTLTRGGRLPLPVWWAAPKIIRVVATCEVIDPSTIKEI
jgi:hypothetical protein